MDPQIRGRSALGRLGNSTAIEAYSFLLEKSEV
jgi:hypothetical protein